jgi:hypothetical protein
LQERKTTLDSIRLSMQNNPKIAWAGAFCSWNHAAQNAMKAVFKPFTGCPEAPRVFCNPAAGQDYLFAPAGQIVGL